MSNPGVVTLSELNIKSGGGFRVEDNLCESIHLHYKEIRIDLTIKELMNLSEVCENCIKDMVPFKEFKLEDYDNSFLEKHAHCFVDLENIETIEVPVKDFLITDKILFRIPVCRKISKRVAQNIINSKKEVSEKCIVVFNNTKVVVTGDYLLAEKYLQDSEANIFIKKMIFDKNKHSYSEHPWIPYLFKWNLRRIINIAKKILHKN